MGLVGPRASKDTKVYILRGLCASPSQLLLPPVGNLTVLGTMEPWEELEDGLEHRKGNLLWADGAGRSSWGFTALRVEGAIIPALVHQISLELRCETCLGESSTRKGDL